MKHLTHLTVVDPAFDEKVSRTYAGQAHWADQSDRTCRSCALWGKSDQPHARYAGQKLGGSKLKPRSCEKFRQLVGRVGPRVPCDAPACRFYEANPKAPSMFGKSCDPQTANKEE